MCALASWLLAMFLGIPRLQRMIALRDEYGLAWCLNTSIGVCP